MVLHVLLMAVDQADTAVDSLRQPFACMITDWLGQQHRQGNRYKPPSHESEDTSYSDTDTLASS